MQSADEVLATRSKLCKMFGYQGIKDGLACGRELNEGTAHVGWIAGALDESGTLSAIDELDGAVVAQDHALGEIGDGGLLALRHSGDDLHELILLGGDTAALGGDFAEGEKLPHLEAELCEALEPGLIDACICGVFHGVHPRSSQDDNTQFSSLTKTNSIHLRTEH